MNHPRRLVALMLAFGRQAAAAQSTATDGVTHTEAEKSYAVTGASIRHNLHGPWVTDNGPFKINQFAHPYQGSIYRHLNAGRHAA